MIDILPYGRMQGCDTLWGGVKTGTREAGIKGAYDDAKSNQIDARAWNLIEEG